MHGKNMQKQKIEFISKCARGNATGKQRNAAMANYLCPSLTFDHIASAQKFYKKLRQNFISKLN